MDPGQLVHA